MNRSFRGQGRIEWRRPGVNVPGSRLKHTSNLRELPRANESGQTIENSTPSFNNNLKMSNKNNTKAQFNLDLPQYKWIQASTPVEQTRKKGLFIAI